MEANQNTKTCINKFPLRINSPAQNSWAQSDKENAETFAKHLADVFKPHEKSADELPEYPQPPNTTSRAHKTNHTPGTENCNTSPTHEKGAWHGPNNPHYAQGIAAQGYTLTYSMPSSGSITGHSQSCRDNPNPQTWKQFHKSNFISIDWLIANSCKITGETHPIPNWPWSQGQRLDSTSIWVPQSPLHHPPVPPHNAHNPQGPPQQRILHRSFPGCQSSLRYSLGSGTIIQNQPTPAHVLSVIKILSVIGYLARG